MTEERKKYQKDYYEKNKEILLIKQRLLNKKNYIEKKQHHLAKNKLWAENNPERMKELVRKHQQKPEAKVYRKNHYQQNMDATKIQTRNNKLKRCYGITQEHYLYMLEQQNEKCLICKRTSLESAPNRKGNLVIDHCHKTKKVRGLLCHNCNAALGQLQDSTELLKIAINYLEQSDCMIPEVLQSV